MTIPLRKTCYEQLNMLGDTIGQMECEQNNLGQVKALLMYRLLQGIGELQQECDLVDVGLINGLAEEIPSVRAIGDRWVRDVDAIDAAEDPLHLFGISNMEIAMMREYYDAVAEAIHYRHWREPVPEGPEWYPLEDMPDWGDVHFRPPTRLAIKRRK